MFIEEKLESFARLVDQYKSTLFQDCRDQYAQAQVLNALVTFSEDQFHDLISKITPDMKFSALRSLIENYLGR